MKPPKLRYIVFYFLVSATIFSSLSLRAQTAADSTETKPSRPEHVLKDPTDGQFDVSYYMIHMHGFLPVPTLITEPSLGGIGGALGLVFMEKPQPRDPKVKKAPGWPNTTLAGGMYTANNSWGVGAARIGSFAKIGLQYRLVLAYANINMNFYRTSQLTGKEYDFDMNMKTIPVVVSVKKDFLNYFTVGVQYTYSHTKIAANNDYSTGPVVEAFRQFIANNELNQNNNSILSALFTFDNRDNVFTPSSGFKTDIKFDWAGTAIGSDFDYLKLNAAGFGYAQLMPAWVGGLRLEYDQVFNDAPFYGLPDVNLRGVPAMRYQNNIVALAEMEHRVRVYNRWSAIGFVGAANAFPDYKNFDEGKWVFNYGAGFRYLIARMFNLHMGADVGFSPGGDWGVYIVFGSSWLRD